MYYRSVLRSVMLMHSFLVGVLAAVIPAFSGKTTGLPFAGLLFTVIAAACFTNFYGDDGTSLWLTLVTPGAAHPDVRGRVWAWFLVTGPAGFLLTVVLTAASGQTCSWPWVLAAEPALVIGAAGLLALIGVRSVNGPAPDGGPAPARVLETPTGPGRPARRSRRAAAALLAAGTTTHDVALRWLAVPVGLAWGGYLCWRSVRLAQQRLESRDRNLRPRPRLGELQACPVLRIRGQHLAGVPAVHVTQERRVDVVAQQFLEPLGQLADHRAGHGQAVVLLGPQPGRHVLQDHPQARRAGGVRAAAMPQAAQVEQRRAGASRPLDRVAGPAAARRPRWLPGMNRVAPLASVNSSSGHMVLTTTGGAGCGSG